MFEGNDLDPTLVPRADHQIQNDQITEPTISDATTPVIVIPKDLKYWINSVPKKSCALVEDPNDLIDGYCIFDIVAYMFDDDDDADNPNDSHSGDASARIREQSPAGRIRSAIGRVADCLGWNRIPREFRDITSSQRIASGEFVLLFSFLKYLMDLSGYRVAESDLDGSEDEIGRTHTNEVISNSRPPGAERSTATTTTTRMHKEVASDNIMPTTSAVAVLSVNQDDDDDNVEDVLYSNKISRDPLWNNLMDANFQKHQREEQRRAVEQQRREQLKASEITGTAVERAAKRVKLHKQKTQQAQMRKQDFSHRHHSRGGGGDIPGGCGGRRRAIDQATTGATSARIVSDHSGGGGGGGGVIDGARSGSSVGPRPSASVASGGSQLHVRMGSLVDPAYKPAARARIGGSSNEPTTGGREGGGGGGGLFTVTPSDAELALRERRKQQAALHVPRQRLGSGRSSSPFPTTSKLTLRATGSGGCGGVLGERVLSGLGGTTTHGFRRQAQALNQLAQQRQVSISDPCPRSHNSAQGTYRGVASGFTVHTIGTGVGTGVGRGTRLRRKSRSLSPSNSNPRHLGSTRSRIVGDDGGALFIPSSCSIKPTARLATTRSSSTTTTRRTRRRSSSADSHIGASRGQQGNHYSMQHRAVMDVFQAFGRTVHQHGACTTSNGRRQPHIDDVISTERKNTLLYWIQKQLGIFIEPYLASTNTLAYQTSAHCSAPDNCILVDDSDHQPSSRKDRRHNHSLERQLKVADGGHLERNKENRDNYQSGDEREDGGVKDISDNEGNQILDSLMYYPAPEAARYITGNSNCANFAGSFSMASYLGALTSGNVPDYTEYIARNVQRSQQLFRSRVLHPAAFLQSTDTVCKNRHLLEMQRQRWMHQQLKQFKHCHVTPVGWLSDPWVNGLLLSEICAAICPVPRSQIRPVPRYDRFARPVSTTNITNTTNTMLTVDGASSSSSSSSSSASLHPRLVLEGTQTTVRSRAQAVHNYDCCLAALARIPRFPVLDFGALEIVQGEVSLWRLLDIIHKAYSYFHRNYDGSGAASIALETAIPTPAGGYGKSSGSPQNHSNNNDNKNDKNNDSSSSSSSNNPSRGRSLARRNVTGNDRQETTKHRSSSPTADRVRFAPTVGHQLNSEHKNSNTNSRGCGNSNSSNRSASPSSSRGGRTRQRAEEGAVTSNRRGTQGSNGMSVLNARKLEMQREREEARLRREQQHKRQLMEQIQRQHQDQDFSDNETATAAAGSTSNDDGNDGSTTKMPTNFQQQHAASLFSRQTKKGSGNSSSSSSSSSSSHSPSTASWQPPAVSEVEAAAAKDAYLPNVSAMQQRSVTEWLRSLDVHLSEGEGGFFPVASALVSMDAADAVITQHTPVAGVAGNAETSKPTSATADAPGTTTTTTSKGDHVSNHNTASIATATNRNSGEYEGTNNMYGKSASAALAAIASAPPLPIYEDRLRNGELLVTLLVRLEPHAAVHAQLPQLVHRKPRSLHLALMNVERALWLFRLRRCPPIPLPYLCQPEQIIKGNKKILWGLLWEIMQAYPYIHYDASTAAAGGFLSGSNANGVMLADRSNLRPVARSDHNSNSSSSSNAEATHRVPSYQRYNYAFADSVEYPVAPHTLPYNAQQRRQLDASLLQWLGDTGVLGRIVGSLAPPTTILALEAYCRDGTLFCMLLEQALGLHAPLKQVGCRENLDGGHWGLNTSTHASDVNGKERIRKDMGESGRGAGSENGAGWYEHPVTYAHCVANVRFVLDTLRRCHQPVVRDRYLYHGVEADIVRGDWDCILGLLEDMHLYADCHPPTPQPQTSQQQQTPHLDAHAHANREESVPSEQAVLQAVAASESICPQQHHEVRLLDHHQQQQPGAAEVQVAMAEVDRHVDATRHGSPYLGRQFLLLQEQQRRQQRAIRNDGSSTSYSTHTNTIHEKTQVGTDHLFSSDLLHDVPTVSYQPQLSIYPLDRDGKLEDSNDIQTGGGQNRTKRDDDDDDHDHDYDDRNIKVRLDDDIKSHRHQQQLEREQSSFNVDTTAASDLFPSNPVRGATLNAVCGLSSNNDNNKNNNNNNNNNNNRTTVGSSSSIAVNSDNDVIPLRTTARDGKIARAATASAPAMPAADKISRDHQLQKQQHLPLPMDHCGDEKRVKAEEGKEVDEAELAVLGSSVSPQRTCPSYSSSFSSSASSASVPEPTSPDVSSQLKKCRSVIKWMRSVGITVPCRSNGSLVDPYVFTDGVLLCELIRRLERLPGRISGTTVPIQSETSSSTRRTTGQSDSYQHQHSTLTPANCVQNVRRCLELLATRHKSIPLYTLSCEEDVLRGNLDRTLTLLLAIKKLYRTRRL